MWAQLRDDVSARVFLFPPATTLLELPSRGAGPLMHTDLHVLLRRRPLCKQGRADQSGRSVAGVHNAAYGKAFEIGQNGDQNAVADEQ